MRSFVLVSSAGCLLPFLILFNLIFGRFFLKFSSWLLLEGLLFLLLILSSWFSVKKINSFARRQGRGKVIDVEGEVIKDKNKISHD